MLLLSMKKIRGVQTLCVFICCDCMYLSVASFFAVLILWLTLSAVQACNEDNCTLQGPRFFSNDCDDGVLEDYVLCLTGMGCPVSPDSLQYMYSDCSAVAVYTSRNYTYVYTRSK